MSRRARIKRSLILFRIASRWVCPLTTILYLIASVMVIYLEGLVVRRPSLATSILFDGWTAVDGLAIAVTLITLIGAFPRWQSLVSLVLLIITLPIFVLMFGMASIIC